MNKKQIGIFKTPTNVIFLKHSQVVIVDLRVNRGMTVVINKSSTDYKQQQPPTLDTSYKEEKVQYIRMGFIRKMNLGGRWEDSQSDQRGKMKERLEDTHGHQARNVLISHNILRKQYKKKKEKERAAGNEYK